MMVGVVNVKIHGKYYKKSTHDLFQGDVFGAYKDMDWTPNTVIEGMACGLPIVIPVMVDLTKSFKMPGFHWSFLTTGIIFMS